MSDNLATSNAKDMRCFSFGDPTPVLDSQDIWGLQECYFYNGYYEPPISVAGLAKSLRANVHHGSALTIKRNVLVSRFQPHPLLSKQNFSRWVMDYLVFGNAYIHAINSRLKAPLKLDIPLAKYTRRKKDHQYCFSGQPLK